MTDCPRQLAFDFQDRRDLPADFDGGLISSDAGLVSLRQLDQRLGWSGAVGDVLRAPRQGGKVKHGLRPLVRTFIQPMGLIKDLSGRAIRLGAGGLHPPAGRPVPRG